VGRGGHDESPTYSLCRFLQDPFSLEFSDVAEDGDSVDSERLSDLLEGRADLMSSGVLLKEVEDVALPSRDGGKFHELAVLGVLGLGLLTGHSGRDGAPGEAEIVRIGKWSR
jgi:hypothetical protein